MRKHFFKLAALAAVAGALSQGAMAADGNISFTGDIVDAPCSISPNSQNLTVPLGKVARTVLDGGLGKKSTAAKFTIDLLGCGATAKGATVTFTGTPDLDDATVLRLANAGQVGVTAATGVGVQIADSTSTKVPLGSESAQYILGLGDNALKFEAAYVSTKAAVTVGPANSTAQFTVNYK